MPVSVCMQCGEEFTAQRSTRLYCTEKCRQKAKRQRKRAARWDHLPSDARCEWCGGPLVPDSPEMSLVKARKGSPAWVHRRKYCSPECRNAARRFRYRVARISEDSPYRVTGDRWALAEPVPCHWSGEWHRLARVVIGAMEQGWVLTREPRPGKASGDRPEVTLGQLRKWLE